MKIKAAAGLVFATACLVQANPTLATPQHKALAVANRLWGNAAAGMSKSDVLRLYPSASPDDKGGLQLQKVMLGSPSLINFVFDGDSLTEVSITMAVGAAEAASGISSTYGKPLGCGPMAHSDIYLCRWRHGTLNIESSSLSAGASVGTIVSYTQSPADSASF